MKTLTILLFFCANMLFATPPFWSKTGHRVVGEIAQEHLTRRALKSIDKLLGDESLALVSNFGDEIKSDRAYSKYGPWHYVNFPADKKYQDVTPNPSGDLITGIAECIRIIKSENETKEAKAFHLKMLVHLVGDLHQPMHAGQKEDKGGNDIQVRWFNRGSNLHRVWDTHMIEDNGMSFTELSNAMPELSKQEITRLQSGTTVDWINESKQIANVIYADVENGKKLSYRYSYDNWKTVMSQLQKGGLRLAKVLNDVFK